MSGRRALRRGLDQLGRETRRRMIWLQRKVILQVRKAAVGPAPSGRPRPTPENEERDGQNPAGPKAKGAGPDDLAEGADEPKDPADERNDEDDDHQWEDDGGAGHANGYSDLGDYREGAVPAT